MRLGLALVLSLVLHVLLLGLLMRGRGALVPSVPPAPSASAPLVLEILEWEAPRAPPRAPPSPAEPTPRTPRAPPARAPLAQRVPAPLPPPSPAPPPEPPAAPTPPDTPRAVRLFPGPEGLPVMPTPGTTKGGGRTWRPGEGPSPEERLAEDRERMRGRVQGFVEDELAVARVDGGLVDPYFTQMRKALEKRMKDSPLFNYQGVLSQLRPSGRSREAREQSRRYGATGTPDDAAGGPSGLSLEDAVRAGTPGARARQRRPPTPLEQMEQDSAQRALDVELELEQSPTGQVLAVKLLRGSGNAAFDQYVLEQVPGALATLDPAAASFAARTRAPTVRSAWNVRGSVSFARTVKLSQLHTLDRSDAAYVAALLAAQNFGGTFDETRGEVTIVDVRRPHFDVRARLLRVY